MYLSEAIEEAISSALSSIHVSLPAKVIEYDANTQKAKVQPFLMRKYKDGTSERLPEIFNVPVRFPRSEEFFIHFPLKEGDKVQLIFCDRSIDKWLTNGDFTTPDDPRKFDISDAVAVPGLYDFSTPMELKGSKEALTVQAKDGYLEIKKDGEITLKNNKAEINASPDGTFKITNGSVELIDQITQLIQDMIDGKNLTAVGPQPKDPIYIAKLQERMAKFNTIKG